MLRLKSDLPSLNLNKTGDGYELSIYRDSLPSLDDLKVATHRLSIAFPKMSKEFFVLLTEFVSKEKFTAERLKDAVNHVIANFQYKELNISDIIQFDRRVKLYNYSDVCDLVTRGKATFEDFEIIEVNGEKFRIKKTDK